MNCPTAGSSPRARGTHVEPRDGKVFARFIPAGAGNTHFGFRHHTTSPVHPRGRGEHGGSWAASLCSSGSSPRARGTQARKRRRPHFLRFIPAGAGNTTAIQFPRASRAVHPRGRGEHNRDVAVKLAENGSSPRARGTHDPAGHVELDCRFIPAGAGNTRPFWTPRSSFPVHPRGRGEHATSICALNSSVGSSPRARGTQALFGAGMLQGRFIPAGAGNTPSAPRPIRVRSVHPRGRGEHGTNTPRASRPIGSSPRARGTPIIQAGEPAVDRFIPAGAGNTRSRSPPRFAESVHPRGRGEHTYGFARGAEYFGSSPRARGTPTGTGNITLSGRFIPAGAGNTTVSRTAAMMASVHPRGRGEHLLRRAAPHRCCGSSPRARGTRLKGNIGPSRSRFIPAGAGNTSCRRG